MTGGNYIGAENIGTISYESGTNPYVFSDLRVIGSSVQIQGGTSFLSLAEVEVYGVRMGKYLLITNLFFTTKVECGFDSGPAVTWADIRAGLRDRFRVSEQPSPFFWALGLNLTLDIRHQLNLVWLKLSGHCPLVMADRNSLKVTSIQ